MEIDRLSNIEDPLGARDHRARSQPMADRNTPAGQVAPGELPHDHGILAVTASRQDHLHHGTDQDDRTRQARRRRVLQQLAASLGLPDAAEIEVEVDPGTETVRFLVRDQTTGQVVGELSEPEVQARLARLQQTLGGLIDRSG